MHICCQNVLKANVGDGANEEGSWPPLPRLRRHVHVDRLRDAMEGNIRESERRDVCTIHAGDANPSLASIGASDVCKMNVVEVSAGL